MSPTPPNTTSRYKVHYTGPFGSHTMLFHGVTGVTQAELRAGVAAIVNDMSGQTWNTTTFNSAEFSAAGSSFFTLDAEWDAITRTSATNPGVNDAPSHFVQYGGRTPSTGKRAKFYLFESTLRDNDTMRYTVADDADVAAIVSEFISQNAVVGAIDGNALAYYGYANVGQNDYLTHKARQ